MHEKPWLRAACSAAAYAIAAYAVAYTAFTTPMPLPLSALTYAARTLA